MKVSFNAYAKINLFLDIESRRADGYHNILSHMQSITLHDVVEVEYSPADEKKITVTCSDDSIPCDKRNLAYKAAEAFPMESGIINIHIEKHIPMSAGLAGGSADAAATLLALNKLLGDILSIENLKDIGYRLGADVPFCIERGACIARGAGEILEKTPPLPDYPILVARHGEGMSTPQAYADLDERNDYFKNYTPNLDCLNKLLKYNSLQPSGYSLELFNIFESVVEPKRPYVTMIKNIMKQNNAINAIMSGSGTAVFGIFKSEEAAITAQSALKAQNIHSDICYPYPKKK